MGINADCANCDALRDASASAQTSGAVGETIKNPIGPAEIVDVKLTKSTGGIQHNHIRRFDEFMLKFSKNVNRANLIKRNKKVDKSKTHFKVHNFLYFI